MVSLPSSRKKHHLTGIDWVVRGLDYMNRKATGAGLMFQIVLELEGVPAHDAVRDFLENFIARFPVLEGRTRRDLNLAPYWRMPPRGQKSEVKLNVHHVESDAETLEILEKGANAAFVGEREHVVFHLVCRRENSVVAVAFDHCLFDAQGAEAFLRMLQQEWERKGSGSQEPSACEPAHLNEWRSKFEAGRRVNRAFLRLKEGSPVRVLPMLAASDRPGFKFNVISFSEEQSRKIIERADREAGYFMLMPYTMALAAQLVHEIFSGRGPDTGDYIIPVTVDMRARDRAEERVFFNHVSFLLFRIRADEVEDLPVLIDSIKRQMYEQVKAGLPQDIREASSLVRIAPLPSLRYLMRSYLMGEAASFCFSFLGKSGEKLERFMGQRVRRTYHMTRVPIPPGLGVFFQQSQRGLNAYVSYADGLLHEGEVDAIVKGLEARLGA